tara:strand:+ start:272 stop:385 length:114 start_codon:yes stop_codon:yes gene_type:complete
MELLEKFYGVEEKIFWAIKKLPQDFSRGSPVGGGECG